MTDQPSNPNTDPRNDAPPALRRDLAELFRAPVSVPAEVDATIRSAALDHFASRRRRLRLSAWTLAAAALLALLFSLTAILNPARSAAPGKPILVALQLARQLDAGSRPAMQFDANHDGTVDRADVDSIVLAATALPDDLRRPADAPSPRRFRSAQFRAVEIWIDPKGKPLAAYQLRFTSRADEANRTIIVGVESGQPGAFGVTPPYFDRTAVDNGEAEGVVLAMLTTSPVAALPSAKSRVATIHVMVLGGAEAKLDVKLETAATADGKNIPAEVSLHEGDEP